MSECWSPSPPKPSQFHTNRKTRHFWDGTICYSNDINTFIPTYHGLQLRSSGVAGFGGRGAQRVWEQKYTSGVHGQSPWCGVRGAAKSSKSSQGILRTILPNHAQFCVFSQTARAPGKKAREKPRLFYSACLFAELSSNWNTLLKYMACNLQQRSKQQRN